MSDIAEKPVAPHRRPNYLLIFAALTLFTVLEVFLAYITGPWRNPVLFVTSFVKVALVVAYFMHLRYDSRWYLLIFLTSFVFVAAVMFMIGE